MMEEITIRDQYLIARLTHLAEQQNRSVEAVLEDLLAPYPEQEDQHNGEEAPPGSLARLAIEAEKANFNSGKPEMFHDWLAEMAHAAKEANLKFTDNNISERTNDVLRAEYADYLLRRMRGDYE